MTGVRVRYAGPEDASWIRALLDERWGGQEQVANGEAYRPADLPGFVAELDDAVVGYAALRILGDVAEIGVMEALTPRLGAGTALVAALADAARAAGPTTLRAITTNDNVGAQAFYRATGFHLARTRRGVVATSRSIKPSIPLTGDDGVPITDELDFEMRLESAVP